MKKLFISFLFLFIAQAHAQEARTLSVEHVMNGSAYFNITVNDDGLLSGKWPGWCADWSTLIEDGVLNNAKFYSSYAQELPSGLVDKPENLDEMNWVLNRHFVGRTSPGGHGSYTSGDVQIAIWTLLNNSFQTSTVGPFSQLRVDEIVTRAQVEGADFFPSCKQVVGILLAPSNPETGSRVQTTVTEVPRDHFPKCSIPESDE